MLQWNTTTYRTSRKQDGRQTSKRGYCRAFGPLSGRPFARELIPFVRDINMAQWAKYYDEVCVTRDI